MSDTGGREFVAYYRVGGLSLDGQHRCIEEHVRRAGGRLLKGYRDEEPLVLPGRPGLRRALARAKRVGATLIVATFHGLSRDVLFLRMLQRSKVDFIACDLPLANASTVHVLLGLAEYEARMAPAGRPSRRKPLDAEARARGAARAGQVLKAQADAAYRDLAPALRELRAAGFTLQEIADRLNDDGLRTRRGRPWNPMQVSRVLDRPGPDEAR